MHGMATRNQRDSQRSKFYNWLGGFNHERLGVFGIPIPFQDLEKLITETVASYGHTAPQFKYISGSRRHTIRNNFMVIPKLMNMHPDAIASLVGWWVYMQRRSNLNEGWHGPTFCRVWAETYSKLTGTPVSDIVNSMRVAKLKVMSSSGTSPAGPRIMKNHEQVKNRVQELEDAIKRGRKEFEDFLQPIIKELETARNDLKQSELKIRG